ncbi:TPA: hypothetical protein G8S59_004010 [Salmonella enterica]|uniref:Uncharacterized protein n=1 Tax=Salmonella enterica TaxID=28901 RepID=A0A756YMY0_SALER|nr:hypothetical protein [Salmonella enterica]
MLKTILVLLISLICVESAVANIAVTPMTVTLAAVNKYSSSIKVFSTSNETQYVKVTVKRIVNPGTPQQKEVKSSIDDGIVTSPQRFILPGQGSHLVRILPLNIPEKEVVYRVYLSSVAGDFTNNDKQHEEGAHVNINITWGVLLYVEPDDKKIVLSFDPKSGKVTNNGNVHIFISEYGFCKSDKDCAWHKIERTVYPEGSIEIPESHTQAKGGLIVRYSSDRGLDTLKLN